MVMFNSVRLPRIYMAMMLLSLIGCGNSAEDALVRKWQEADGINYVLEFFDDGTFSQYPNKDKLKTIMYGQWKILSDGRVKMVSSELDIIVSTLEFDGDEMIMTDEKSRRATRYKKL